MLKSTDKNFKIMTALFLTTEYMEKMNEIKELSIDIYNLHKINIHSRNSNKPYQIKQWLHEVNSRLEHKSHKVKN